jgi:hypothetical protein
VNPNPVKNLLSVEFTIEETADYQFRIVDSNAKVFYNAVISKYPTSKSANTAQEQLNKLQ